MEKIGTFTEVSVAASEEAGAKTNIRPSHTGTGLSLVGRRSKLPLPNFFVVGAAKAGTTSLYQYLGHHPQIYVSPIKEPHYFATDLDMNNFGPDYRLDFPPDTHEYIWGEMSQPVHSAHVTKFEDYQGLFRKVRNEKAIGEASVTYLCSPRAAAEIKARIPEAKIIIMLRDPAERAFSHYLMDRRLGIVARTFAEELHDDLRKTDKAWGRTRMYIELGLYFEQVKRFLELFGPERVRIYLSHDLRADRTTLLRDLYDFLEVDPKLQPARDAFLNESRAPRFPRFNYWMHHFGMKRPSSLAMIRRIRGRISPMLYKPAPRLSPDDRAMLVGFFADDIRKLQDLIARDLLAWMRPSPADRPA
jgi:hypothetical protein